MDDTDTQSVKDEPSKDVTNVATKKLTKAQKTAINERIKGAFDWLRKKQI